MDKQILIVEFTTKILGFYERLLVAGGRDVYTYLPEIEGDVLQDIVKQVNQIKPDVLIIGPYPVTRPENLWPLRFDQNRPIGLEAVELLRLSHEDMFVVYISRRPELLEADVDLWTRMTKTDPMTVVRAYAKTEIKRILEPYEQVTDWRSLADARQGMLETFFFTSPDALFIKDKSLSYFLVNEAMERLIGRSSQFISGRSDDEIFAPKDAEHFRELELRVLEGETKEEEYTRYVNGVELTSLDLRVPVRIFEKIIGIYGVCRDITDRRSIDSQQSTIPAEYPSPAMQNCLKMARQVGEGDSIVLLLGENGSGKDYLAKYIHDHSSRSNGPYFSLNCAAISEQLAESELFGHEKGAFTGAVARKRGVLELAEGGTLLLNEIGELSLPLQAKLLTFLDKRRFTRVGGVKEISVNARLMAATNRDLEKAVADGEFRQDLFYRLNVVRITVPPLRERREDIPVLAKELVSRLATDLQLRSVPTVDAPTMAALVDYPWPGNVRELRNVLERALILKEGPHLKLNLPRAALEEGTEPAQVQEPAKEPLQGPATKRYRKPTDAQRARIYKECIQERGYARADVAEVFGRVPSTVTKWFPQQQDFDAGDTGRRSDKRDLEALRSLIEEIMR